MAAGRETAPYVPRKRLHMSGRKFVERYAVLTVLVAVGILGLVSLYGCGPAQPNGVNPGGPRESTVPTTATQPTQTAPASLPPGYNPGGPRRHK
jgi:hypothetical protein